jgi:hypothetical protein
MIVQYISDNLGNHTAVIIPIEEWGKLTTKYSELSDLDDYVVPNWHKDIVLKRLETLKNNPADLISVETLFDELEKDLK